MTALITILHIIVCLVLILAVLLQSGKSADLAGAFGGGGSQLSSDRAGRPNPAIQSHHHQRRTVYGHILRALILLSGRQIGSVVSGEEAPVEEQG